MDFIGVFRETAFGFVVETKVNLIQLCSKETRASLEETDLETTKIQGNMFDDVKHLWRSVVKYMWIVGSWGMPHKKTKWHWNPAEKDPQEWCGWARIFKAEGLGYTSHLPSGGQCLLKQSLQKSSLPYCHLSHWYFLSATGGEKNHAALSYTGKINSGFLHALKRLFSCAPYILCTDFEEIQQKGYRENTMCWHICGCTFLPKVEEKTLCDDASGERGKPHAKTEHSFISFPEFTLWMEALLFVFLLIKFSFYHHATCQRHTGASTWFTTLLLGSHYYQFWIARVSNYINSVIIKNYLSPVFGILLYYYMTCNK